MAHTRTTTSPPLASYDVGKYFRYLKTQTLLAMNIHHNSLSDQSDFGVISAPINTEYPYKLWHSHARETPAVTNHGEPCVFRAPEVY